MQSKGNYREYRLGAIDAEHEELKGEEGH